ncbi:hypothetical protein HAX54_026495, partial [Datura stramonium]|nr:hypothetical protein [Datura stramonium]
LSAKTRYGPHDLSITELYMTLSLNIQTQYGPHGLNVQNSIRPSRPQYTKLNMASRPPMYDSMRPSRPQCIELNTALAASIYKTRYGPCDPSSYALYSKTLNQ